MGQSLAAQMALSYIDEAEVLYSLHGDSEAAQKLLLQILDIETAVEGVHMHRRIARALDGPSEVEVENRRIFTNILTRGFALMLHMGDGELAQKLYLRALALAEDPICSSQAQHDEIIALWKRLHAPWWKKIFRPIHNLFYA